MYDLQDEVEAYQRMQMFGKYSGQNINANWVVSHGSQGGAYQGIKGRTNQITTTTPTANFPGALNYGKQVEYQINKAGKSSTIPKQVIIYWQHMY